MLTKYFFVINPGESQSLSRWHKRPNSSTTAAHGEKAICRRPSRPSPTAAQLDDQREESINFYGGLVQRSHREANFSPPEERSPLAGTPMHGDVCSEEPSSGVPGKEGLLLSCVGANGTPSAVCSSPFLELADEEPDTSWMNTTTTMVESCSPSSPVDWWKWDSMFMGEGDISGDPSSAANVCRSSSSVSTGERFPPNARKTASADVCRIKLDKSPRRSFSGAATSVTVHGVCNKTNNGGSGSRDGGSGGGGNGKFYNKGLACPATVTSLAPPEGGYNSSGTVAAGTPAALAVIGAPHQQRTLSKQCDDNSIRLSSTSSNSGRSSRQESGGSERAGGCHFISSAAPAATSPPTADDGLCDELSSLMTPLLLPVDWTNETCIGGGLDFSSSIAASEQQQQQQQQQKLWINSPTSSSSNTTDGELERQLDDFDYTATRDGQQHHLLTIAPCGQQQIGSGAGATMETRVDCRQLLVGQAGVELNPSSPISLHEEIEQLSSGFDCDASNHLISTKAAALDLPYLSDDKHPLQHATGGETISLNIMKWLQEDISSAILVDKQPTKAQEITTKDTSNTSYFLTDSPDISLPSTTNHLQLPLLGVSFESSNINLVAGGSHKTAIKSQTSIGRGNDLSASQSLAAAASTGASSVDPQCDHNYFTMKRRIQDSGDAHSAKHKLAKLSHDHRKDESTWGADNVAQSSLNALPFVSPSGLTPADAKQSIANAILPTVSTITTASINNGNPSQKRLSVAHRKAPTLKVNVAGDCVTPMHPTTTNTANLVSTQGSALIPDNIVTKPMTATTTTSTTLTTMGPTSFNGHHRIPPHVTLNTPDLTNDILDLEDEKFDLLSFIDTNDDSLDLIKYNTVVDEKSTLDDVLPSTSGNGGEEKDDNEQQELAAKVKRETTCSASSSVVKDDSREKKILQLLTLDNLRQLTAGSSMEEESTLSHSSSSAQLRVQQHHFGGNNSTYSIGSRSSASSVCGDSDVSSSTATQTPKRRGRPPKAVGTVRDRSQYEHLSEADWRYREQRDKNNEASRKSRINRKDRELKLESEADRLSLQHQKLSYEERRLQRDCQKWRKAVMKLALL